MDASDIMIRKSTIAHKYACALEAHESYTRELVNQARAVAIDGGFWERVNYRLALSVWRRARKKANIARDNSDKAAFASARSEVRVR